jgi:hypothetical protein
MNSARLLGGALATLGLIAGCSIPAVYTPAAEVSRAPAATPSFVPGGTTYRQALESLRAAGVTNLAASEGELPDGRGLFRALTGDRLSRVYFFEGGRFRREAALRAHAGTDVALAVKAVVVAGRSAAMVIGPELADDRGTLGIIIVVNDASGESATIPRLRLAASSDGPHLPLVLGASLDSGVFLTARDGRGDAWYHAFLIRFEQGALRVARSVNVQRLLSCSCARHWYFEPRAWLSTERRRLDL